MYIISRDLYIYIISDILQKVVAASKSNEQEDSGSPLGYNRRQQSPGRPKADTKPAEPEYNQDQVELVKKIQK